MKDATIDATTRLIEAGLERRRRHVTELVDLAINALRTLDDSALKTVSIISIADESRSRVSAKSCWVSPEGCARWLVEHKARALAVIEADVRSRDCTYVRFYVGRPGEEFVVSDTFDPVGDHHFCSDPLDFASRVAEYYASLTA